MRNIFHKLIIILCLLYSFQSIQKTSFIEASRCGSPRKKNNAEIIIKEGFLEKLLKFYEACTDLDTIEPEELKEDNEENELDEEIISLSRTADTTDELTDLSDDNAPTGFVDMLADKTANCFEIFKNVFDCLAEKRCCFHKTAMDDKLIELERQKKEHHEKKERKEEKEKQEKMKRMKRKETQLRVKAKNANVQRIKMANVKKNREDQKKKIKRNFKAKCKQKEKMRSDKQKKRIQRSNPLGCTYEEYVKTLQD